MSTGATQPLPRTHTAAPLARRCVFARDTAPLLLTEVFLGLSDTTEPPA